ncbi:hypothetical protein BJ741DRAFT_668550 [Chytriomyces cf. hyalinus JEL632]|nr:hypothetical protein BJ741DRAFT_668550 [Chytriomyces cf. hyalinus JEL632]
MEMLDECSFHSGYLDISQEAIVIRADVSKCETVIFSGHSLGGAMAHTLHALYLLTQSESETQSTYSIGFGAPVTFGLETEQFLKKHRMGRRFTTIVNKGDHIDTQGTMFSLSALMGTRAHFGAQYHEMAAYVEYVQANRFAVGTDAADNGSRLQQN